MPGFEPKTPPRRSNRPVEFLRRGVGGTRRLLVARPSLGAAAIYAVLAVVLFGHGAMPGRVLTGSDMLWRVAPFAASSPELSRPGGANHELNDAAEVFEPFLEYTEERLPHAPLWNPHIMAGRPYLADAQSAVLSPFSPPSYVLPRRAYLLLAAMLKVFVAAFGTFLLARALGLRYAGALLAGVVYGFAQLTVDSVTWPQGSVRVLLPWLLLLVELVIRSPRAVPAAGLAALVGVQFFGGHPETSYYVMFATAAFALFRLAEVWGTGRDVRRPALALALAVAAGTALAAVVILPFAELLRHSSDIDSREQLGGTHLSPDYLLGLLLPTYWGRPTQTSAVLADPPMVIRAFYVGALPLMLAAAALLRPSARRAALAAAGLCALAVVAGFEPFLSIAQVLPGPVRTDRLTFVFVFAAALLAGAGLDDLIAAPRRVHRGLLIGFCAALACFPLVYVAAVNWQGFDHLHPALTLAWGFHVPLEALDSATNQEVVRLGALLEWLPFAAAGAALVALRSRLTVAATAFAMLAIALTAVDLFKISMGYNPTVTFSQAAQPATGAIRYLQRAAPDRFAGVDPKGFPPDLSMRYDLYTARGRDYPVVDRFTALWSRNIAPVFPDPRFALPPPDDRALRALGLMSVAYLMQDPRSAALENPAARLVYDKPDARIYRNRHALPRAFLVGRQQVAGAEEEALAAVESPSFDGRAAAITEEPIPGLPSGGLSVGSAAGSASITAYSPERVVVRTRAARRSLLVLTDTYFPGWNAEVDGEPADVHRVDYLFRGVRVPPGVATVTFRYEPTSYRVGWVISLTALFAIVGAAVAGWRRGRPR